MSQEIVFRCAEAYYRKPIHIKPIQRSVTRIRLPGGASVYRYCFGEWVGRSWAGSVYRYHREGGPAIYLSDHLDPSLKQEDADFWETNGTRPDVIEAWCHHGKWHRDGYEPALTYADGVTHHFKRDHYYKLYQLKARGRIILRFMRWARRTMVEKRYRALRDSGVFIDDVCRVISVY